MEHVSMEMEERTPKRSRASKRRLTTTPKTVTKRQKANPKPEFTNSDDDGGNMADAVTPRVREIISENRSPSMLASPGGNGSIADDEDDFEEEEDLDGDDEEQDENYEVQTKRKTVTPGRKKRVAKRKLKNNWTVLQEFDDDVSAEDYLETTSWFKDKEVNTPTSMTTHYFCGEAPGKSCPAKAYSVFSAVKDGKVVLYVNDKEHKHQSGKRGIPEVVKREIRRILEQNEVSEISEILAKLTERKMQLPTKPQIKSFVTVIKKPKVRLPKILKARNERAVSSDVESVGNIGEKRSRSMHQDSSEEE